ncbi:Ger(x)C family spore germination protein [Brevibacillus fortis]|uniref:Ger(x)C family spore germination protein n=1 Tax=Brevibacillus fortis TaxID=2126352 RepID=UPI002E21BD92|nr:Ger(x)C family spore germination protein [Brevibacillus fortis]
MNLIYKKIVAILVFLPLFFLTGCWSAVEINDRSFARMMFLDKSESGIELTLSLPLPNRLIPGLSGGSGELSGAPYTYVTKSGRDIEEAYRSIQADMPRRITFGQTGVIIIGKELAEEGITPILDFAAREPRFHINTILFVTPGKAKEVASIPIIIERFPADILLAYERDNVTISTTVNDVLMSTYYGGDTVLPMLKFEEKRIPSEKKQEQKWMENDGAAIFKQGKLVTVLSMDEMRGAMWILNQMKNAQISVHSPTDHKNVNYILNRIQTRIKPVIAGSQITMEIQTGAEASLISTESNVNLQDEKERLKLEQRLEAQVENRMSRAIAKTRKVGTDPFQFAAYLDWYYPKQWKAIASDWREYYREKVIFTPKVDITIKRLGTVKKPIRVYSPGKWEAVE